MRSLVVGFCCFAMILFSLVSHAAEKLDEVNVCIFDYREEMASAALLTAENKGLFKKQGLKVNWKGVAKGVTAHRVQDSNLTPLAMGAETTSTLAELGLVRKLASGGCDLASTTFESIVGSKLKKVGSIAPLAVYRYGKDYDSHLTVRKDLDVKTIADLKGKRVRASQIGVLVVLQEILKSGNLTLSDVQLEKVDVPTLPKAMDEKTADVVLAYVPTIPLLLASNKVKILEKDVYARYLKGAYIPHSILAANRKFLRKNPATIQKFMAAFEEGAKELSKHPENVIYGGRQSSYVDQVYKKSEIEKSLNFFNVQHPLIFNKDADFLAQAHFEEYQTMMFERGFIKQPVDLSAWKMNRRPPSRASAGL